MSRILIVDDDESRYIALKPRLEKVEHTVVVAKDRREAEHILESECFNLLLIDVYMPDEVDENRAGILLIKRIRDGKFGDWGKTVHIVVPTAFPSTFITSEHTDDPFITMLPIPIPTPTLFGTIQNLLK